MKKFIAMMLLGIVCLNSTVYAADYAQADVGCFNTTEYITPSEQLTQYLARTDITPAQREQAIAKHNLGQAIAAGNGMTRRSQLTENVLDVPWYSQETNYYCGPATVKQTVQYLNGTSDTQDEIAEDLNTSSSVGTDTNLMKEYLNNNTDCVYEVLWWWANADAFSEMVISNTDNDIPIIGHVTISASNQGNWPYRTSGHYINYNGYLSSGDIFAVTDPFADRYGYTDGKYTISNDDAEGVTGRIIW